MSSCVLLLFNTHKCVSSCTMSSVINYHSLATVSSFAYLLFNNKLYLPLLYHFDTKFVAATCRQSRNFTKTQLLLQQAENINHTSVHAGGITTLIDMPLNSFPSTVSEETLKLKVWINCISPLGFLFFRSIKCE